MPTLHQTLHLEFTKMLFRRLDFAPAPGDLPAVVQVAKEDLAQTGLTDDDNERVAQACAALGRSLQKWPTVAQIIGALPKREQPRRLATVPMPRAVAQYMHSHGIDRMSTDECRAEFKRLAHRFGQPPSGGLPPAERREIVDPPRDQGLDA